MQDSKFSILMKGVVLCIVVLGIMIFKILVKSDNTSPVISQSKGSIVVNMPPNTEIGSAFQLTDQHGKPFSSSALKGEYSLIYFGFARCPDICPATLRKLDEAVTVLHQQGMDKVKIIFITLDPQRDTPSILADYLINFDNHIIGLTGSVEEIKQVSSAFKVFHHKIAADLYLKAAGIENNIKQNSQDYLINHTSLVYLMDPQLHYLTSFHFDTTTQEIVNYLRSLNI